MSEHAYGSTSLVQAREGEEEKSDTTQGAYAIANEGTRREVFLRTALASMHHDIGTLLTRIRSAAGVLRHVTPPEHGERVDVIDESARQIRETFDSTLELLHLHEEMRKERKEQFNLSSLIWQTASLFRPRLNQKGIALQIRVPQCLTVTLAREHVARALRNLMDNAIAHTSNGQIAVHARYEDELQERVRIEMRDTGVGIPPETLPHIFKPFERGSDHYQGSGLGLAIVQRLVRRMGGEIDVESEPGEGTTFTIYLPNEGGP